ncbi:rab11 family-interacting protein 1 [Triplophysa rosa]|uniref:rab11 family-interacting protein 1 n=1 Tax=Triplophysa rosa TaxID=992332 RepID=UPI0025462382|nr:rab11 family-interacting protein 1 [Triplophysa rosa]
MSLGDQQWYPTSVQVTVLQARNLRIKGKNGTNDAYAIMQVGKDKFSTSVAEKCVAPAWKEEATFDLPLVQQGHEDRCMLYIIAMHRALVGLDKFLGQAVINLVDLHANKLRKKTDWYKLVDRNGKQDKDRGEVFLDIQYMRNNLTASMFDLSMADKPRSGISKLKDKIRGKKKDSFSDSASEIVSVAGTDSEGEGEDGTDSPKKKSKIKSLFGPKTNLHKNVSKSMLTLGTLPEKNSPLSISRSSGLNVESPDVKKKFKFLGHKRNGSTDSKVSRGPFSLLSRSKQNVSEQNNLCINGSHVYAEDQDPKPGFGSTLSLNSSGNGSVEDVRKHHQRNISDVSADSLKALSIPSYKPDVNDKDPLVQQRPLEDRSLGSHENEEKAKKQEARSLQEMLDRQEEQEKRRRQEQEEERKRRLEEQDKKRKEEEELQRKRRDEEMQRVEEQRHQEENRVTERLSSLFGIGKKKEEKKEEASPPEPKRLEAPSSLNRFEDISLTQDNPASLAEERSVDPRMGGRTVLSPAPPTTAISNRTAAVKPSAPSSGMFSDLHSSLAPPKPPRTFSESPRSSMEEVDSFKKRRAPQPPGYSMGSSMTENYNMDNGAQVHNSSQRPSFPLPDYEMLYPKKRHGVMAQMRWDHVIAEVSQRNWDLSEEMNVDGPEQQSVSYKSVALKDRNSVSLNQHQKNHEASHPADLMHKEPLIPPKPASAPSKPLVEGNVQYRRHLPQETERGAFQAREKPTPAARTVNSKADRDSVAEDVAKDMPSVKPRQRSVIKDPVGQVQPDKQVTSQPVALERIPAENGAILRAPTKNGAVQRESFHLEALDEADHSKIRLEKLANNPKKDLFGIDPLPSDNLTSKDPWALPQQNKTKDEPLTSGLDKKRNLEDQTVVHANHKDAIFASKKTTDPFTKTSENRTAAKIENKNQSPSFTEQARATFQKNFSLRKKNSRQYPTTTKAISEKSGLDRSVSQSSQDADDVELTVTSVGMPDRTESTLEASDLSLGGVSGGKTTVRSWVSPSDAQPVTLQNGSGSAVSNSRRPHPVKPMSTTESQPTSALSVGKDMKTLTIREMAEKSKNTESTPYTQLTQEELITLVVKQQDELSKKEARIQEMEDYIDNLLVRVMEEKPTILLSLQSKC